jgi:hypothetical protein
MDMTSLGGRCLQLGDFLKEPAKECRALPRTAKRRDSAWLTLERTGAWDSVSSFEVFQMFPDPGTKLPTSQFDGATLLFVYWPSSLYANLT